MNNMLMEAVLITDTVRRGMLLNGKAGGGRAGGRVNYMCRCVQAAVPVRPPLFCTGALRFFRAGPALPVSS